MSEKKHVVYWGKGKGRMYEGLKQKDPTVELRFQTDKEAAASGACSLESLIPEQGSVGKR